MKILCIGDIYGKPGRETVLKYLPELQKKSKYDFVLANAENMAHGRGVSSSTIQEMRDVGVHFFTTGNHVWDNKEGMACLDDVEFPVIRPANYPEGAPGRGYQIVPVGGKRLLIINLMGRVFMGSCLDCPFKKFDEIYNAHSKDVDSVIVDLHAETTSEKIAFRWYVDGRATLLFGTHTHVPSADAIVTHKGTGYITDLGMTGPSNTVIGVSQEIIVEKFLTQLPKMHEIPKTGPTEFHAIEVELNGNKTASIQLIRKLFGHV